MTQQQAKDQLLDSVNKSTSKFVYVPTEVLALALGATPEIEDHEPDVHDPVQQ